MAGGVAARGEDHCSVVLERSCGLPSPGALCKQPSQRIAEGLTDRFEGVKPSHGANCIIVRKTWPEDSHKHQNLCERLSRNNSLQRDEIRHAASCRKR
jgi:hypothetical protein